MFLYNFIGVCMYCAWPRSTFTRSFVFHFAFKVACVSLHFCGNTSPQKIPIFRFVPADFIPFLYFNSSSKVLLFCSLYAPLNCPHSIFDLPDLPFRTRTLPDSRSAHESPSHLNFFFFSVHRSSLNTFQFLRSLFASRCTQWNTFIFRFKTQFILSRILLHKLGV